MYSLSFLVFISYGCLHVLHNYKHFVHDSDIKLKFRHIYRLLFTMKYHDVVSNHLDVRV